MFFSSELLSKRDGGFGLLWLAATLGSKSTFKKLPKRSVLTADISQLCHLIADPAEPLALRLSSNLMVGVARVYRVKQDIFMTDITNCVASLKKVLQDSLNSTYATNTQLQMIQSSVRPSALTLTADPKTQFTLDFDALVADWDEYLNIHGDASRTADDADNDSDFNPKTKQTKHKTQTSLRTEVARGEMHTLTEHHEHLLSASFDLSYHSIGGDPGPSSSQLNADFGFDTNFSKPLSDELLDFGGLADELEKELGWGPPLAEDKELDLDGDIQMGMFGSDMNFDFEVGQAPAILDAMATIQDGAELGTPQSMKRKKAPSDSDKENYQPSPSKRSSENLHPLSPTISFSYQFISQDGDMNNIVFEDQANPVTLAAKKVKRTRLLLDARTELTDEELKTARAQYLQAQGFLRQEMSHKCSDKHRGRMIEEMVWGVPSFIQAPALADFWQENFKVQVDARSGSLRIHRAEEPPRKRRRMKDTNSQKDSTSFPVPEEVQIDDFEPTYGDGMDIDVAGGQLWEVGVDELELDHIRSSEEPGQGRRMSRPPVSDDVRFDHTTQHDLVGSQKSSLFPWDNAGMSSSSSAPGILGSDQIYVDPVELKLRGSSLSRRSSSLIPSQVGSFADGFSPAPIRQISQAVPEDYVFESMNVFDKLEIQDESPRLESQPDVPHISLERNSFNFLEYARMQWQSLPTSSGFTFDTVVPHESSTRHIAAAALYHCLVLATKDLLRLDQQIPYGPVSIAIIMS